MEREERLRTELSREVIGGNALLPSIVHDYDSKELSLYAKEYQEKMGFILEVLLNDYLYAERVWMEVKRAEKRKNKISSDVFVSPRKVRTLLKGNILSLVEEYVSCLSQTKETPVIRVREERTKLRKSYFVGVKKERLFSFFKEFAVLRHGIVRKYAELLLADYKRLLKTQEEFLDLIKQREKDVTEIEKAKNKYFLERKRFIRKHGILVEEKLAGEYKRLKEALERARICSLKVIRGNQRLVAKIVNTEFRKRNTILFRDFEEAVSYGNIALMIALEKYNAEGAFSTIAYYWIKKKVGEFLEERRLKEEREERILRSLYGNKKFIKFIESDEPTPEEVVEKRDLIEKFLKVIFLLPEGEKEVVEYYLKHGKVPKGKDRAFQLAVKKLREVLWTLNTLRD